MMFIVLCIIECLEGPSVMQNILMLLFGLFLQMDYIAGSFYDGFILYAMALQETLAEGGAQNDGINITMRTQNRQFWGEFISVNL